MGADVSEKVTHSQPAARAQTSNWDHLQAVANGGGSGGPSRMLRYGQPAQESADTQLSGPLSEYCVFPTWDDG